MSRFLARKSRSADLIRHLFDLPKKVIGLGRPLTAEPDLPLKIQESGSEGARPNLVDASLQTPAALAQIAEIASKKELSDLSKEDVATEVEDMLKRRSKPEDKQNNKEAEA